MQFKPRLTDKYAIKIIPKPKSPNPPKTNLTYPIPSLPPINPFPPKRPTLPSVKNRYRLERVDIQVDSSPELLYFPAVILSGLLFPRGRGLLNGDKAYDRIISTLAHFGMGYLKRLALLVHQD